jgi:hypothetical protein
MTMTHFLSIELEAYIHSPIRIRARDRTRHHLIQFPDYRIWMSDLLINDVMMMSKNQEVNT